MTFYTVKNEKLLLSVRIKPNARTEEVLGIHDNKLVVAINQPPIDGKANAGLIELLSQYLKLPKSSIELVKGQKSKDKQIQIPYANKEKLDKKLACS